MRLLGGPTSDESLVIPDATVDQWQRWMMMAHLILVAFVVIIIAEPAAGQAHSTTPEIRTALLGASSFGGFILERERPSDRPFLTSNAPFWRTVQDQMIRGSWSRTWRSVDGQERVLIEVIDFRNNRTAQALMRPEPGLTSEPGPSGGPAGSLWSHDDVGPQFAGREALAFKGRTGLRVAAQIADVEAAPRADEPSKELIADLMVRQLERITPGPDQAGTALNIRRLSVGFNVTLYSSLVGVPLMLSLVTSVLDPAVRRRLLLRLRRRPALPAHAIDVDAAAKRRLQVHRWRVLLRMVVLAVGFVIGIVLQLGFLANLVILASVMVGWSVLERKLPGQGSGRAHLVGRQLAVALADTDQVVILGEDLTEDHRWSTVSGPQVIERGEGGLWVLGGPNADVALLDPSTGSSRTVVATGADQPDATPFLSGLLVRGQDDEVWQVDAGGVVRVMPVRGGFLDLAAVGGKSFVLASSGSKSVDFRSLPGSKAPVP